MRSTVGLWEWSGPGAARGDDRTEREIAGIEACEYNDQVQA